jgi:uncharacterized membrane protein
VAVPTGRWSDQQVERLIGRLLQTGVVISAVVAFIGGILYLIRFGSDAADYRTFHGVPDGLNSVSGVLSGAAGLHSRWIIQLGLLLLIATPVARVALSLVAFALQRDRTYVAITALVLSLLVFSLIGG